MLRAISFASFVFLAQACASSAQSVPVKGPDSQIIKLAGEWEGSYEGTDSGRVGTINFDLDVGRHTANGTVVMYTDGAGHKARPLSIKFVAVAGNVVEGKIEPYTDPQCECKVRTEFRGKLEGNSIDGTFTTRIPKLARKHTGQWAVYRK